MKYLDSQEGQKKISTVLAGQLARLDSYLSDYQDVFRNRTKQFFDKAVTYSRGLFVSCLRNIEKITESSPDADYFKMQHFITEGKWSARAAIDKAAMQVSEALPRQKLTGLIIDESGGEKKGKKSVGVAHQYCGNLGKTANCQVAVMACLNNGDFAATVDARLYLPKAWCKDGPRCNEAGIPEANRQFKTKLEMAYDMVLHQHHLGTRFDFVSGDGLYGHDPELADKVADLGYRYMFDVHRDQHIYLEQPELALSTSKGRGRPAKHPKPDKDSIEAYEYATTLDAKQWSYMVVRNTSKGKLKAWYHFRSVFIRNKTRNTIEKRLLVIRKTKTKKGTQIKYSVTNASLQSHSHKTIAYMQAQRFFVEHTIKEQKQVLGMDEFQTRKWKAWQHQIALSIMACCFLLKEKIHCFPQMPLLSKWDIREWLAFKLHPPTSEQQQIDRILHRHRLRQNDINRYYKDAFT